MIDPIKNTGSIPGLQQLTGAAQNELRAQRGENIQKPEAAGKSALQPVERGVESPLEGISGSAKANAYIYWPKDGKAAGNKTPGPMARMRLWHEAVGNVLTGDTEYGSSPLHANIVRAGDNGRGALAGQGVKQRELAGEGVKPNKEDDPKTGCETCAGRKYKDGSNDSGVSFQSATGVPASTAGLRVASHEGEHVTRETADAQRKGEVITNRRVTFQYGCCPECNRMYIKGGRTSITRQSGGEGAAVAAKMADMLSGVGENVNMGM